MGTILLADEFLLLEIEGEFPQFEPFFEPDSLENFDVDEPESRPREQPRWGFRIPCPGVRYYFFE